MQGFAVCRVAHCVSRDPNRVRGLADKGRASVPPSRIMRLPGSRLEWEQPNSGANTRETVCSWETGGDSCALKRPKGNQTRPHVGAERVALFNQRGLVSALEGANEILNPQPAVQARLERFPRTEVRCRAQATWLRALRLPRPQRRLVRGSHPPGRHPIPKPALVCSPRTCKWKARRTA